MSEQGEDQPEVWGKLGNREPVKHREDTLLTERERVGRLWKVTIAGLLALYAAAMALWLVVSSPGNEKASLGMRRTSSQRAVNEEKLAFEAGQLFGGTASLWGGALAAALLFRSARTGRRVPRRSPGGFAVLFGLGVILSLGGLVLLWRGLDHQDTDPVVRLMRVGGALITIVGSISLSYAFTRPLRELEAAAAPTVP
jgi:hypothetical protein